MLTTRGNSCSQRISSALLWLPLLAHVLIVLADRVTIAAAILRVLLGALLDEHETILNSYQAQKYGGGEGSTGEVSQG